MRIFLGITVLGSLFLMAIFWQQGITQRSQQKRTYEQGQSHNDDRGRTRWATLVLGKPSGADLLPAPVQLQPGPSPTPDDFQEQPTPEPEPDFEPDLQYTVQSGDVLGTICKHRYGTAKLKVIKAVALYNDLKSVDAISKGQVLALPSLEVLFPQGL
ncbi:MAG: hypothetical protein GY930_22120 [bacterium]|nr:hypothetical protein [bacterium]